MTCHNCKTEMIKAGFFKSGAERIQRFRCKVCGKRLSDIPERPLDDLRIPLEKAVQITHMLCEGVGVRAAARLASVHRDTVLAVLEVAGRKCARLLDERIRNVPCESVQVDEIFAFVKMKEKQNIDKDPELGTQYIFLGVCAESKLILNFAIGKRDRATSQIYMEDLKKRVKTPFQLTTDGYFSFLPAVYWTFFNTVHFAQLQKKYLFERAAHDPERRYSPPVCIGTKKRIHIGNPCVERISTSYVERTNLSVRMFNRRFTRLTLGYSKKLANLKHSVALFTAHFNFCRKHSTHGQTPAQKAGLTDHQWT